MDAVDTVDAGEPVRAQRRLARARTGRGAAAAQAVERAVAEPELAALWREAEAALAGGDLAAGARTVDALTAAVMRLDRSVARMDGRYVARCVIARVAEHLAANGAGDAAAIYDELAPQLEGLLSPPHALSPRRG